MSRLVEFPCVIDRLKSRRETFDFNYHQRVQQGLAGLYAFWLGTGACLYVGRSRDIRTRIYQHRTNEGNEELDSYFKAFVSWIDVSYIGCRDEMGARLEAMEDQAIQFLQPLTNKTLQYR